MGHADWVRLSKKNTVRPSYEVNFSVVFRSEDHMGDAVEALRSAIENMEVEGDGDRSDGVSTAVSVVSVG